MSKHFQFLLLSVALFIGGYVLGRQNTAIYMHHFTKAVFLLILLRVIAFFELGILRLPLLAFVSGVVGVSLGMIAMAPAYQAFQFIFFLFTIAPFYFLSALLINEYRQLWDYSIVMRAGLSTIIGYGLYTVFHLFLHLSVPHFNPSGFLICAATGFVISYGAFYLYRRDAEKLNNNLAMSFFLGVPVLRAISSLKDRRIQNICEQAFEALYIPMFTSIIIVSKYHQISCRLYQSIGWGTTPVPEEAGKCLLEVNSINPAQVITVYGALVAFLFLAFYFLSESKSPWLKKNGKKSLLIILSLLATTVLWDNLNLTLIGFICPLSALFIKPASSR